MALTRAEAIDASYPNAVDIRKHNGGYIPKEGLFPDPITVAAAGVAFAGTGWNVSARAFVAALKRGGNPFEQTYGTAIVSNDGTVTAAWTVGAAPGSGSRIDRLCIRARDTTQGDSATGAPTDGPSGAARTGFPEFLVVNGTAGTPGVAPALPAGYEEVGQITVSAGNASAAAASIANTYGFAFVVGGIAYFRTAAEVAAWTTNVHVGQRAYAIDTATTYEFDGANFVAVHSPWISYTPTWTAVTTAPVVGNGSLIGRYRYVGRKTIEVQISILFGSTTNGGAGAYTFALPVQAANIVEQIMPAKANGAGGFDWPGFGKIPANSTTVRPFFSGSQGDNRLQQAQNANAGGGTGTGIPNLAAVYTYVNGSQIIVSGRYEIA